MVTQVNLEILQKKKHVVHLTINVIEQVIAVIQDTKYLAQVVLMKKLVIFRQKSRPPEEKCINILPFGGKGVIFTQQI